MNFWSNADLSKVLKLTKTESHVNFTANIIDTNTLIEKGYEN